MLPNVSKLRLDGGGAARKPAPTDDNLVPLSVLDEPIALDNLKDWGNRTAQKAYDWFKAQGENQRACMYTTDSLAQGCDPADTETWNRLFWVATKPQITIPYAAQVSGDPPEPDWAAASVALPIPKPWLEDGPQAIIQVTPSTTQGVPGVHFVHKATLLKMFAIQRQKYPDGVDGISYPYAYRGPGYGKPDLFIPQRNGTNMLARAEMRAILNAFLKECDGYRTTIGFLLRDGTTLEAPVKLYEMGCDVNRQKFDFEDSSGEYRQTNPFPTPWKYGTGTNAVHYTNFTHDWVDGAGVSTPVTVFRFGVTEAPRPVTPPPRRRTLPDSFMRAIVPVDSDDNDEEEEEEEDDSSSEDSDEEMQDSVPGPMTDAINDANALERASVSAISVPEDLSPVVERMLERILQFNDTDYKQALSDEDVAMDPFIRALTRLWDAFHHLDQNDVSSVHTLLLAAAFDVGIMFEIRQLVASDVPRLKSWMESNLQGVSEDDLADEPSTALLRLVQDQEFAGLNAPDEDLTQIGAYQTMESHPSTSMTWVYAYRSVAQAMRRIAHFSQTFAAYRSTVESAGDPQDRTFLAKAVLRLVRALAWDDADDEWDAGRAMQLKQIPLIDFLDTMTSLAGGSPVPFMQELRQERSTLISAFNTFIAEFGDANPEYVAKIESVMQRLEATPPPPPLASQRQQASAPAVQGAEALREIANSPSPEREEEEEEEEEMMDEGTLSPAPTPNPAPVLRRNSSDGYQTRPRTRQRRTGATLRRTGLLLRFF